MPTWEDVIAIASRFPGVEVGKSWGTDAWPIRAPKRLIAEDEAQES